MAMEYRDSFLHYDEHAKSSLVGSGSILPLQQANTVIPSPINNSSNGGLVPNLAVRDKDRMPVTNVTKIMTEILPNNAEISVVAQEMIIQSATKYINFVTRKAKERTQSEYRKTTNAEDLLWAIEKLGFNEYVGPLTTFIQRYRTIDNNGPTLGPEPNLVPTLEMHRPSELTFPWTQMP